MYYVRESILLSWIVRQAQSVYYEMLCEMVTGKESIWNPIKKVYSKTNYFYI